MARTDGLVRLSEKTPEERSAIGRKGGLRSVEVRKENMLAKRAATIALKLQPNIDVKQKAALKQMGVDISKPLNVMTISMVRIAYQAMNGNIKAFRFLLDMAHMSPNAIFDIGKIQLMKQQLDLKDPTANVQDAEIVEQGDKQDTSKIEAEIRKMGIYGD
ncbi:hypothetical protein SAMN05720470_1013 [Fibrobacter sp. UWOV1]|uniref:hypothetical protein n=1 Tax=Fibrobacter sp. UWOV1 TaxID=1896215 RepID=UPI00092342AE|nr:hypothetical protein [Fibrobacter sp. UWOV1]SHK26931.1 hypothetical protein SAMN05720470_1013 [Fibrobacter sp. UWOV1]